MNTKIIPTRSRYMVMVGAALIALALFLGWLSGRQPAGSGPYETPQSPTRQPGNVARTADPVVLDKSATASPADAPVLAATAEIRRVADQLARVLENATLSPEQKKAEARGLLVELRQLLRSAAPDAATAAILEYLESGADASTGLGFTLEAGGILEDAPSTRIALLDMLGQLDPSAAAEYAGRIFDVSQIADEWSLALRNLGWQNQDGIHTDVIRTRFQEMLRRDDWIGQPSEGFLQAFDTAVHLGGVPELDELIGLVLPVDANDRPVTTGLTHAAYLGLDRMTVQNPLQTLETLTGDPRLLAWAPEHRASLVARADVSQPAQRAMVETYLTTLADHPQELETFTRLFPNRNGSLSHNLITTPPTVVGFNPRDLDRAALRVVEQWLQNGNYQPIEPSLRRIAGRLTSFVREDQE